MSATDTTNRHDPMLRIIGVFKLMKAVLLVVVGITAMELSGESFRERAGGWLQSLAVRTGEVLPLRLIALITEVRPRHFFNLGIAALVYSCLFIVEGVNLLRGKRWAEYLTVVATGSFIPLELYEVIRHVTAVRLATLFVNIAVLIYLIWHIRRERHTPAAASSKEATPPASPEPPAPPAPPSAPTTV